MNESSRPKPAPHSIRLASPDALHARVVTRRNAPAAEEYAAEELRRHLHLMAGLGPQIRNRAQSRGAATGPAILLNDPDAAAAAGIRVDALRLLPEGYHLETRGGDVHLLGGGPRGVLYGVYDLLESLGCRWFTPEVSRIPRGREILLAPVRKTAAPAFEFRDMWVWEGSDPAWWVRNRMNGWYTPIPEYMGGHVTYGLFVHTFDTLLPPVEFFEKHPEYFSLVGGARRGHGGQLCLSNPDVLRMVTRRLLERMRANPRATIWSVSQNDCEGYCECPQCAAIAAEEGSQAGPILRFVNAVATETVKEFPDKLIDTLAYWYSLDAPRVARPRPNVRVRLCPIRCCQGHPFGTCDHSESSRFLRALRGWSRITEQMYIWHYCTNFANYPLPMPDYDELHANINLYKQFGVYGVFMQGMGEEGGGAETMALRGYVIRKLLWNPSQPVWPLIDEFLAGYYGRAARGVRTYLDTFHAKVRRNRHLHPSLYDPPTHPLFDEKTLKSADAALAKGERSVRGDERRRVRLLRHGLTYARLGRTVGRYRLRGHSFRGQSTARDRQRLETIVHDWRAAGIQRVREGAPFEFSVHLLRNRLGVHRVEWLRDDDQKIAVVPALGGRILEWHASGRQWLAPPDPANAWNPYPMNEGYVDFVIQGLYGHYGWAEQFDCRRRGRLLELTGKVLGSLHLRRTLRLCGGALQIESRLENRGSLATVVGLGPSLHLQLPSAAAARVVSDGASYSFDSLPEGLEKALVLGGDRLPQGEWRVDLAGFCVIHRFAGPFERAILGRMTKPNRLALDLRTRQVELAPGASLAVTQTVRVERR